MAAPKGHPRYGGRQKGTPNKSTAQVKEAMLKAYQSIGGDQSFAVWARENPTEFYRLWSKMLPQEISGPDGGPIEVTDIADAPLTTEEWEGKFAEPANGTTH